MDAEKTFEQQYQKLRSANQPGWGGQTRIANSQEQTKLLLRWGLRGKVLEIGCGEGNLCRQLSPYAEHVVGIDFSSTAIEWAREKSLGLKNLEFVTGDIANSATVNQFSPHRFDWIVDGNCLHCLPSPERIQFYINCRRWLDPGGILFLSHNLMKELPDDFPEELGYRHCIEIDELLSEVSRNGFIVLTYQVREHIGYLHIRLLLAPEEE